MNQEQRLQRITHLFEKYEEGNPEVSDRQYDELVTEFLSKGGSYEQIYGDALIRSDYPCLSQDNIYDESELMTEFISKRLDLSSIPADWVSKHSAGRKTDVLVCSPKFDGVSIYLLIDTSSREIVSVFSRKNKRLFPFIEAEISRLFTEKYLSRVSEDWFDSYNELLTVRVEVILPKKVFDNKYRRSESNPNGKANPRNAVSGLLNSKYPSEAMEDLHFKVFDKTTPGLYSEYFPEKDYPVVKITAEMIKDFLAKSKNLESRGAFSTFLDETFKRVFEEYDCDGVVLRADSLDYRQQMGNTGHHWAAETSYKNFNDEKHETVLEGVTFTLSPSGEFFPVGNLKPVQFKDAEVSNVTLNSMRFMEEEFETPIQIGSILTIIKSGDIIPKVVDVEAPDNTDLVDIRLDTCPFCAVETIRDGAYLFCKNTTCPERRAKLLVKQIEFLQEFLGLKGVSDRTIRKLFCVGVRSLEDCVEFDFRDNPAIEDAIGPSMADKVAVLFETFMKKDITLGELFKILQIEDFGTSTIPKFDKWVARNRQDHVFVDGKIRVFNLESVVDEFFDKHTSINSKVRGRIHEKLKSLEGGYFLEKINLVPFELDEESENLPKYIVTGSLAGMSKKEFSSSVTGRALEVTSMSQVDYLVCNSFNPEKPSGKAKKAVALQDKGHHIKIVNQEEFLGII